MQLPWVRVCLHLNQLLSDKRCRLKKINNNNPGFQLQSQSTECETRQPKLNMAVSLRGTTPPETSDRPRFSVGGCLLFLVEKVKENQHTEMINAFTFDPSMTKFLFQVRFHHLLPWWQHRPVSGKKKKKI